ncbi:tRNA pseudouridine(38-40) synthase TruA [Xanthovirga aplysinae]|uniref:tRNA pseudouridine(38-40) synthase TruA n=1 Tax=Xanthovirga aplysinae TaxID=2529853 RepID=UPI001657123B|nr:tRNA pseudouridine(38-40) synthase TruA [Xanthovirga aplysinae]
MKYFLEIAYKGTAYHGWQIQQNARTVQGELEGALKKILGLQEIKTMGSGRTDTGVHARQQFLQVEVEAPLTENKHGYKLNAVLPRDISVSSIRQVYPEANARFDAVLRSYEYHIHQRKDPFLQGLSYYYPNHLDVDRMNQAATHLLDWQDFECFSKVQTDVKTFLCDIEHAMWKKSKGNLVFHIRANRFLRGMVRAITGTLLEVGAGKRSVDEFRLVLESRDRNLAGRSVPAQGLFLTEVHYPKNIFLNS